MKDLGGIIVTILIGIAGAIVGGFLGSFVGLGKVESFDLSGIFIATVGTIILLIIYRLLKKRSWPQSIVCMGISLEENAKNKTVVKQFPIHENSAHSERVN